MAFLQLKLDCRVSGFLSALYLITSFSVFSSSLSFSSPSFIELQPPLPAAVDGISNGPFCSEIEEDAHAALSTSATAPLTQAALLRMLLLFF